MKKGDTIIFNFHAFGEISSETAIIHNITEDFVQIEAEDEEYRYKFSLKTGKCLNETNFLGSYRTINIK